MEKTTLYLPGDLQIALREAARRTRRPQAELVREALARYLADQPRPKPKSIGIAAGLTAGLDITKLDEWIEREMDRDYDRYLRDAGLAEPGRKRPRTGKRRSSR